MSLFLLYETSLGYCIFEINGYEEIQQKSEEFENSVMDFKKISKIITLKSFLPFKTSKQALENITSVTQRVLSEDLEEFLKTNIPSKKKSKGISLAVLDNSLGKIINETLGINITVGDFITQIERAIRYNIDKYLKISENDIIKSQLGLGHSYSRMKCMFDVNRQDKPVIQSIALIDQLDKNINSFCMRIKEWFGWHFPELYRIVPDNSAFVKVVQLIQTRNNLSENKEEYVSQIEDITQSADLTKQIIDASSTSMGSDLSEADLYNVKYFTDKVIDLINYRHELLDYLTDKMRKLAPNVSALVGETVAARLISHAGSLANLAKYPASTIQILGAEKALFRALKTRGKTPKYGILYHTSFIGKASQKNKGKISRYIANKLAVCARIDYFTVERYDDYGKELKNQIEERLTFLNNGVKPRKNLDVMKKIHDFLSNKTKEDDQLLKKKKNGKVVNEDEEKPKKKKKVEVQSEEEEEVEEKPKKKKKVADSDEEEEKPKKKKKVADSDEEEEKPKKKKKTAA